MAIITLITSEIYMQQQNTLQIEKRRLRITALALALGFIITVVVRVFYPF
ncbi:MAG: hypothetical protein QW222_02525 [Candidatus Bathyarchaeia archaeon]